MIPHYPNQYQQRHRHGKPKTLAIVLSLFVLLNCTKNSGDNSLFPLVDAPTSRFHLIYNQIDLFDSQVKSYPDIIAISPGPLPKMGLPRIEKSSSQSCLFSHSELYASIETGLQFEICDPELSNKFTEIEELFNNYDKAKNTLPSVSLEIANIYYKKYSEIIKQLGEAQYLIDGSYKFHKSLGYHKLSAKQQAAWLAPIYADGYGDTTLAIQRVFPLNGFDLIATNDKVYLLFRQPGIPDEVLAIEISDEAEVSGIKTQLHLLFSQLEDQRSQSHPEYSAETIEFYSGNKDNAWISFQSTNGAGYYNIDFSSNSHFKYAKRIFMHADSVVILSKDTHPDFGLNGVVKAQNIVHTLEAQLPFRSNRYDLNTYQFRPAWDCQSNYLGTCGKAGIPLLALFNSQPIQAQGFCRTDNLRLTEMNFAGINTNNIIDPKGKFIELQANANCKIDNLALVVGNTQIHLGNGTINKDDYILITAHQSYFDPSGSSHIIENHSLQYLSTDDSIFINDHYRQENSLLFNPQSSIEIIQHWGNASPVYSIDFSSSNISLITSKSCGIRPDLGAKNMMNPACISKQPVKVFIPEIAEVLTRGAYDNTKKSLPAEEFIEFEASTLPDFYSRFIYKINIYDNHKELVQSLYLPPLTDASQKAVLSRDAQLCHTGHPLHSRSGGLRIPDYGLMLESYKQTTLIQRVSISKALDTQLNGAIRKSYHRISKSSLSGAELWYASAPDTIKNDCHQYTYASPGREPEYDPFIQETENNGSSIWEIFSKSNQNITLAYYDERHNHYKSETLESQSNQVYNPVTDDGTGRNLIVASLNDEAIFAGTQHHELPHLVIQTISAVEKNDEVEWIRICSPNGFHPGPSESLRIQDAHYEDIIVPARHRLATNNYLPELATLDDSSLKLGKNECAILVDPDFAGQALSLRNNDKALWTIESSASIGNGLSATEPIGLYIYNGPSRKILTTFALQDAPIHLRFSISTNKGECIERKPNTLFDQRINYEVQSCN